MAQTVSIRAGVQAKELPIDLSLSRELSRWKSSMVGGMLQEPLPAYMRSKMQARFTLVRDNLAPAPRDAIEEEVSMLMASYPSMRNIRDADARVMSRKYAEDLSDMPLWAIKAASRDLSRGAVSDTNPDFPPSSARIHQLAENHIRLSVIEAHDLKTVLTAKAEQPENPEMRERIKLGFASLAGRLHQNTENEKPKPEKKCPAITAEQLTAHYSKHGLGYKLKPEERS